MSEHGSCAGHSIRKRFTQDHPADGHGKGGHNIVHAQDTSEEDVTKIYLKTVSKYGSCRGHYIGKNVTEIFQQMAMVSFGMIYSSCTGHAEENVVKIFRKTW